MIRRLPSWYGDIRENIERSITKQANKLNIRGQFVWDSKIIEECVSGIMNVLVRLQEEVKGEFNEEQLKNIKKLEEVIEKEKQEEDKKKSTRKHIKSRK